LAKILAEVDRVGKPEPQPYHRINYLYLSHLRPSRLPPRPSAQVWPRPCPTER